MAGRVFNGIARGKLRTNLTMLSNASVRVPKTAGTQGSCPDPRKQHLLARCYIFVTGLILVLLGVLFTCHHECSGRPQMKYSTTSYLLNCRAFCATAIHPKNLKLTNAVFQNQCIDMWKLPYGYQVRH